MHIGAVYMASGQANRFGSNKLLHEINGRPLYQYGFCHLQEALDQLAAASVCQTTLVVVSAYEDILRWCRGRGALTQKNGEAAEGIAASVRLGIQALPAVDAYAFFVADQPCLTAASIAAFIRDYVEADAVMACAHAPGRPGNPGIFAASWRDELLDLSGDRGGAVLLRRHAKDVHFYEIPSNELADVDTPADLSSCLSLATDYWPL